MKWKKLVDNVDVAYAPIIYEENVEINKLFPKLQPLLDEFHDVVLEDILLELHSTKNI
jgi:hypothetical protein